MFVCVCTVFVCVLGGERQNRLKISLCPAKHTGPTENNFEGRGEETTTTTRDTHTLGASDAGRRRERATTGPLPPCQSGCDRDEQFLYCGGGALSYWFVPRPSHPSVDRVSPSSGRLSTVLPLPSVQNSVESSSCAIFPFHRPAASPAAAPGVRTIWWRACA